MGFRFRKSIKIAPGVRLNIGKKSASISVGGRGVRHTISSTGREDIINKHTRHRDFLY